MALIRLVCVFTVVAVVCPLVGFDLTHVVLVPLMLGAGLVAAGSLAVNAKAVAGPAFAWTCGLIGASFAAHVIKVQVQQAFSGASGWLLLAGIVAAGTLALVAQVRGTRGAAAKGQKTSTRVRAAVVDRPEGIDGDRTRPALAVIEEESDTDETERLDDDELNLFSGRNRRGR